MKKIQKYLIFLILALLVMSLSACEWYIPFLGGQEESTETESVETTAESGDSAESTEEENTEEEVTVDTSDVHVGKDADYEWEEYQPFP